MSAAEGGGAPSTWFVQQAWIFRTGSRVLDIACGGGRHAIAAAELGAVVTAVDGDASRLQDAVALARERGVTVEWVHLDLERASLPPGPFDVVMVFYYLDRQRMSDFLDPVRPGGYLLAETYLEGQRLLAGGPDSDAHLLKAGELIELTRPFELVCAREVMEHSGEHAKLVASVLAQRPPE